jgi:hypothetical protein
MYAPFGLLGRDLEIGLRGMMEEEQTKMQEDQEWGAKMMNGEIRLFGDWCLSN